jgi:hypothetical protein
MDMPVLTALSAHNALKLSDITLGSINAPDYTWRVSGNATSFTLPPTLTSQA